MGRDWIVTAKGKHQTFGDDGPSLRSSLPSNLLIRCQKAFILCVCTVHRLRPSTRPVMRPLYAPKARCINNFADGVQRRICRSPDRGLREPTARFFELLKWMFVPTTVEV